jgi:hypothetical protein
VGEMNNLIGIKYNKPLQVFDVLMDSEPDSSMILCKDKEGAEKILYQYYLDALLEIDEQYYQAIDKIRRVK